MSAVPLTTDQGVEWFPAVSPVGREVAFSWNGEMGDNFDIYVKSIGGGRTRLTTDADMDLAPAWSPDGGQLGFVRWRLGAPTFRYIVIPAHGGTEREIGQGRITPNSVGLLFPALAWTPDGSGLIVADAETPQSAYSLKIIAASKSERLPVTKAPQDGPGDCCPAVSPDGRKLAFLRASFDRQLRPLIVEVDRAGRPLGEPRQIEAPACRNPIWSADSSELICIGSNALWRLGVQGGPPRQILTLGVPAQHLSLQRGNLVYSTFAWEGDIWQLQTGGGRRRTGWLRRRQMTWRRRFPRMERGSDS